MPSLPGSADLHPLLARIATHASRRPDASALICDGSTTSYAELWQRAERLARELRARGLEHGDRVALKGERSPRQFVNLLAILIAGGIYVPLGEKAPPARQAKIIEDAGPRFSLSDTIDDIAGSSPQAPIHHAPARDARPMAGYILYTSGSTGQPKGVHVTLDNVLAYVGNIQSVYPLSAGGRTSQLADLGFDASVHEIFQAWWAGATLCVIPGRHVLMWPRYVRDLAVDTALLVPSQVRLAAHAGLLRDGLLPGLKRIFLGAELLTGKVARLARNTAPNAEIVNLWGPTEGTVALTHHRVDQIPADHEDVPIGRAWIAQDVRLDPEGGELIISGAQLSQGYWHSPENRPSGFAQAGDRKSFRTGDLARTDPIDGYRFAGRKDRQVKIKGQRVELEECERVIRKISGADHILVALHEEELVCFMFGAVPRPDILEAAAHFLPAYMVPKRIIIHGEAPLNASGKLDVAAILRSLDPTT